MLFARLGLTLPRPLLRRVAETTLGNPLFALEMGRALAERGRPGAGEEVPLPDAVDEALGARVAGLAEEPRRLLLAVALSGALRPAELEAVAGRDALDDAVDDGVLVLDGGRVRAAHPLLAATARRRSRRRERRALHLTLAGAVTDDELRARHLALATDRPDPVLAATLDAAASAAAARGAVADAVQLAGHALRLTPAGGEEHVARLLALAERLETAGDRHGVTELLAPRVDALPPGPARVRAWVLLSEGAAVVTYDDHRVHLERALAETGDDARLRALVLAKRAVNTVAEGVERLAEAEAWAAEALEASAGTGSEAEQLGLRALGWARSLRGRPIDDVCERFRRASGDAAHLTDSPEPVAGLRLLWRGELEPARASATRFLALADQRGEAVSYAWLRLNLCELELRAGAWDAAARLLDEWAESGHEELLIAPTYQRCRALLAAGRGLAADARAWAEPAFVGARARGYRWQVLEIGPNSTLVA